jgi:hypothetical protein
MTTISWPVNSGRNGACGATPNCDEHVRGLGHDTTLGHWNFNGGRRRLTTGDGL